ncbi:MAG: hypothetical protein KC478_03715 [Bacteriovoracaceae bacterium]|nr:hypothetical protein [Bacteriovoracaceae bacterium]
MELSNSYDSVIIGKSYVSIIFAIVQKERHNAQNMILDDERFQLGDKWNTNIGELEKKSLEALGRNYNIDCLCRIEQFVSQSNTLVFLNEKMIELGSSPFSNIKELARKLPECFSTEFIEGLEQIVPETFDAQVDAFFTKTVAQAFENQNVDLKSLFAGNSEPLESIFNRFLSYLKNDKLITNQLHYILQALFQTLLSNVLSDEESRYLLSSILSPRYNVDTKSLEEELMFAYKSMGGKSKTAKVQDFEIYKGNLEYILLDSFEGLIKSREVFLFGHFGEELPFKCVNEATVYESINVSCPIKHKFSERFTGKRIIFSPSDRMGTDFPHWEVVIDDNSVAHANYVFASYEGAKPSFHFKRASEDLYQSLNSIFPGLNKTDWDSQISFTQGKDVWLENVKNSLSSQRLKIHSDLGSECHYQGRAVKKLIYCGPLRGRFLGYFGYLLNIFTR